MLSVRTVSWLFFSFLLHQNSQKRQAKHIKKSVEKEADQQYVKSGCWGLHVRKLYVYFHTYYASAGLEIAGVGVREHCVVAFVITYYNLLRAKRVYVE